MRSISELWAYRELFYFLAWRDIKVRYKQTALGVAWAVLQPFLTTIVFTIFFGKLAKFPSDGTPYPVFYLSGILPWIFFSSTISLSSNSLISNVNLLTKVYFPRVILPAASSLASVLDLIIGLCFLVLTMILYDVTVSWRVLLWPALIIQTYILTLGLGSFLAALNVKYRDVKYIVPFALQIGIFLTPVIYPMSMVPKEYQNWLAMNPLTGIVESFRFTINPGLSFPWGAFSISLLITGFLLIFGTVYFQRTEREFADVV